MQNITQQLRKKYREKKTALLLFSGGLDTSFLTHFFSHELGWTIHTLFVDVGGEERRIHDIERRAYAMGADRHYTIQAQKEFVEKFLPLAIFTNARFYGQHPLSSSLSRPLMALVASRLALQKHIPYIMHGSNRYQNNRARFEKTFAKFFSSRNIIAPFCTVEPHRRDLRAYLERHGYPMHVSSLYSSDVNLWGQEIEDHRLLDPAWIPDASVYRFIKPYTKAPRTPLHVSITFQQGLPVALDGKKKSLSQIIHDLNAIGVRYSVGRFDALEDRVLGHKEREIHESPAAHMILLAHKDLEISILPKAQLLKKSILDLQWVYFVFQGDWFLKKKIVLDTTAKKMNEKINGTVTLQCSSGCSRVVGRALRMISKKS